MTNVKRKPGFTIIEILLVVMVLSIATIVSLPNLKNTYKSVQLKQESGLLAHTMRYAQSRAVAHNKTVRLVFDEGLSGYFLEESYEDGKDGSFNRVQGRWGRTRKLFDGTKVKFNGDFIDFYPDDTIDKNVIDVCNEKSCFSISTKEQLGYVRVSEKWNL